MRVAIAACLGVLLLPGVGEAQHLRPTDLAALPVVAPSKVEAYGADPLQFGELRLPKGRGPFPVAIIIHGGCWTKGFATLTYMAPLASALAELGVATWNVEYRQLGDPGAGWPGTFRDWAAATDHLRQLAKTYPLDLTRVVVVGHSAGAQAALWVASRKGLPTSSEVGGANPLPIAASVAIDGPGDLKTLIGPDAEICRRPVIVEFMGGSPQSAPAHYREGNPIDMLPSGVPSALVASAVLEPEAAEAYRAAATAKGDQVEVLTLSGAAHFDMLAPASPSGAVVEALVLQVLNLAKP